MGLKKLSMLFALVIGLAMVTAGCPEEEAEAGEGAESAEPASGETEAAEEGETAEAEPADEGGGGGACDRVEQCCTDYVAALPGGGVTAEQACAGVGAAQQAGEATCQQMIDSWKQSLEAASIDVPASCGG